MRRTVGNQRSRRQITGIAYDGERTEDEYFRGWSRRLGTVGIVTAPFYVKSGGNALDAVKASAKKALKEGPFDELWCVCDVDDTTESDMIAAKRFAAANRIQLCTSTRSFEIWIALHFEKISLSPVHNEKSAVQLVAKHYSQYSTRKKSIPFEILSPLTKNACVNSRWLREQGIDNPITDVDVLVNKLIERYESGRKKTI